MGSLVLFLALSGGVEAVQKVRALAFLLGIREVGRGV